MPPPRPRVVAHADMDAFYAAVEQHDRPELRGKPVIIGFPGGRGVVCTASYEARPYGVGSAMPMARAMRLCPHAEVIAPRFERYVEVSSAVMETFETFSPQVEALSLDEAFLELTGTEALFGPPAEAGARIRAAVRAATGLTVSVGVASSKYVAKVASDLDKPDGLTVVPAGTERAFLAPLPVKRLWGVGPKAEERLRRLGRRSIGDLQSKSDAWLAERLGDFGVHLGRLAAGDDPREVVPDRDGKSVGSERTLDEDVEGEEAIRPHLLAAADEVAARLRKAGLAAGGVRVKLKSWDFRLHTRQELLARPSDSADELYEVALRLLPSFDLGEPFRLVGLAAYGFDRPVQRELFEDPARAKRRSLDTAVDRVREKFGDEAVRRAGALPHRRRGP